MMGDPTKPRLHPMAISSTFRRVVFDIETAPDFERVERLTKPFDESTVKLGNTKDEALIRDKIKASRKAYYDKAFDTAALHAETAKVCAIGYSGLRRGEGVKIVNADERGEEAALIDFWDICSEVLDGQCEMCGFNVKRFDLPFLIRRSFHLGIAISTFAFDFNRRRWHSKMIDLMEVYGAGEWGYMISLDKVCRSLDIGSKSDKEVSGKDFWRWWRGQHDDRRKPRDQKQLAGEYLTNDIEMTAALAARLCGVAVDPDVVTMT